jgi:hypothetical protein
VRCTTWTAASAASCPPRRSPCAAYVRDERDDASMTGEQRLRDSFASQSCGIGEEPETAPAEQQKDGGAYERCTRRVTRQGIRGIRYTDRSSNRRSLQPKGSRGR